MKKVGRCKYQESDSSLIYKINYSYCIQYSCVTFSVIESYLYRKIWIFESESAVLNISRKILCLKAVQFKFTFSSYVKEKRPGSCAIFIKFVSNSSTVFHVLLKINLWLCIVFRIIYILTALKRTRCLKAQL